MLKDIDWKAAIANNEEPTDNTQWLLTSLLSFQKNSQNDPKINMQNKGTWIITIIPNGKKALPILKYKTEL